MACGRQNNSCGCGCGNNNDGNHGNGHHNDYIGNRRCRRDLREAVDTLIEIQDLADDFLDDFFNERHCRCGNGRRFDRDENFDRDERDGRGGRDGRDGCGCGCDNYWGR